MISPAEISNTSPGSMVMMSSMAQVITKVSLGVAANAGVKPWLIAKAQAAATPRRRRFKTGSADFME